jgi:GNAT superfamily N-acetyltransferase
VLSVERVLDPRDLPEWHAVSAAAHDADYVGLPTDPPEELIPLLAGPVNGERTEFWLGRAAGIPVAAGQVTFPLFDNTSIAHVDIQVDPQQRRHGYARDLLPHLLQRASGEGRTTTFGMAAGRDQPPVSPGVAFSRAVGARAVLTDVRRLLEVSSMPADRLAELAADAERAADGYTLVQWQDRAPEELHAGLAVLKARMSTDTPMEDMVLDAEAWDVPRFLEDQEATLARGRRTVACAVRHRATGQVAGFTELTVNRRRTNVAYQWDTIVLPAHRGHRLGLWLKAANLCRLRTLLPETRLVNTWNAAANPHMIAINETLGFRPAEAWTNWRLDLPASPADVAAPGAPPRPGSGRPRPPA